MSDSSVSVELAKQLCVTKFGYVPRMGHEMLVDTVTIHEGHEKRIYLVHEWDGFRVREYQTPCAVCWRNHFHNMKEQHP